MMTPADRKTLERYIVDLARLLWLDTWKIFLRFQPAEIDVEAAKIEACKGRRLADLYLAWDFREQEPQKQRQTLVHELLHLHFISADHVVTEDMAKHPALNDHEHDFIAAVFIRQLEYGIDDLANAIAPLMPLIPWKVK